MVYDNKTYNLQFMSSIYIYIYIYIYRRAPESADSVSAISVIRGLPRPEKIRKLKK
jgi:hypothetical protein